MNSALRTGPQWTRTSGNAGLRLASVLIALSLSPGTVRAGCFSDVLRADGAFADQIERDPKGTVTAAESALASTAPQPAGGASRAQLYAVIMDARQNAEDIGGARDASARGLAALVATDSAGLRRRLELTGIKLLEQQGRSNGRRRSTNKPRRPCPKPRRITSARWAIVAICGISWAGASTPRPTPCVPTAWPGMVATGRSNLPPANCLRACTPHLVCMTRRCRSRMKRCRSTRSRRRRYSCRTPTCSAGTRA